MIFVCMWTGQEGVGGGELKVPSAVRVRAHWLDMSVLAVLCWCLLKPTLGRWWTLHLRRKIQSKQSFKDVSLGVLSAGRWWWWWWWWTVLQRMQKSLWRKWNHSPPSSSGIQWECAPMPRSVRIILGGSGGILLVACCFATKTNLQNNQWKTVSPWASTLGSGYCFPFLIAFVGISFCFTPDRNAEKRIGMR